MGISTNTNRHYEEEHCSDMVISTDKNRHYEEEYCSDVVISTNINRHYEEEQFSDVVISTDNYHSNQPRLVSVARLSMEYTTSTRSIPSFSTSLLTGWE